MTNLRKVLEPDNPAKFSKSVLDYLDLVIPMLGVGFDPFAGVGTIQRLRPTAACIEIESEWAMQAPGYGREASSYGPVIIDDALAVLRRWPDKSYDWCATSPTYGNRMADYARPKPGTEIKETDIINRLRHTYRHYLRRPLTPGNTGALQWGDEYRAFHAMTWAHVFRVLRPEGLFILNVSDHIRNKEVIPVADWHKQTCLKLGFILYEAMQIATPRNGHGANGKARVPYEMVYVFSVPS